MQPLGMSANAVLVPLASAVLVIALCVPFRPSRLFVTMKPPSALAPPLSSIQRRTGSCLLTLPGFQRFPVPTWRN